MKIVLIILGLLLVTLLILSAYLGNGEKVYRASPELLRIFDVLIVLLILGIAVISFSLRQKFEDNGANQEKTETVSVSENEPFVAIEEDEEADTITGPKLSGDDIEDILLRDAKQEENQNDYLETQGGSEQGLDVSGED